MAGILPNKWERLTEVCKRGERWMVIATHQWLLLKATQKKELEKVWLKNYL
jgi:hypothetical protein